MDVTEVAKEYLKCAPKGPYKDMVSQLLLAVDDSRGALQDLKVDLKCYPIRMVLNADGSFMVDAEDDKWLEAFEKMFLDGP